MSISDKIHIRMQIQKKNILKYFQRSWIYIYISGFSPKQNLYILLCNVHVAVDTVAESMDC